MSNFYLVLLPLLLITPISIATRPKISRLKGIYIIGPHNKDVITVLFGSLLGDVPAEKRSSGTIISFFQEAVQVEYLLYLHKILSELGYCNPKVPTVITRLGPKVK
jgi:ubiquinol-cytochrome c reductase cytochrome b subunit